jgi:hypothetical protein
MKQFFLLILISILSVNTVQAAKCTSTATGNWSAPSTWSGCGGTGVPGTGAFANYSAVVHGGHTVTLDDTRTIYATNVGDTTANPAILTIGNNTTPITITMQGDMKWFVNNAASTVNMNSGAGLTINMSTALIPDVYFIPGDWNAGLATWNITGTPTQRVYINGVTGHSGFHTLYSGFSTNTDVYWDYVSMIDLVPNQTPYRYSNLIQSGQTANRTVSINHSLFKNCGYIVIGINQGQSASLNIKVKNSDFREMTAAGATNAGTIMIPGFGLQFAKLSTNVTGEVSLENNTFYGSAAAVFATGATTTISGNVYYDGVTWMTSPITETNATYYLSSNIASGSAAFFARLGSKMINSLFFSDSPNTHWMATSAATGAPFEFAYNVVDSLDAMDNFDMTFNSFDIHHNYFIGPIQAIEIHGTLGATTEAGVVSRWWNNTYIPHTPSCGLSYLGLFSRHELAGTYSNYQIWNNLFIDESSDSCTQYMISGTMLGTGEMFSYKYLDYNAFYTSKTDKTTAKFVDYTVSRVPTVSTPVPTNVGVNDISIGQNYNQAATIVYDIKIIDGSSTPNTYAWRKDGGTWSTTTPVSTAYVTIDNQIAVKWGATTGHTTNGTWTFTASYLTRGQDGFAAHDIPATALNNPGFASGGTNRIFNYNGLSTRLALIQEMMKKNGHDYSGNPTTFNSLYEASLIKAWIVSQNIPTNAQLIGTGRDGSFIGAYQPIPPIPSQSIFQRIFKSRIFK